MKSYLGKLLIMMILMPTVSEAQDKFLEKLFDYGIPNRFGTRQTVEQRELERQRMEMIRARQEFTYNDTTTTEGVPETNDSIPQGESDMRLHEQRRIGEDTLRH